MSIANTCKVALVVFITAVLLACAGVHSRRNEVTLADWAQSTPFSDAFDEQDIRYFGYSLNLNPNESVPHSWRSHKISHTDDKENTPLISVVSGPMYSDDSGRDCREFILFFYEGGKVSRENARYVNGLACRPSVHEDPYKDAWVISPRSLSVETQTEARK